MEFECPYCKTRHKHPNTADGKKAKCSACGKVFFIGRPISLPDTLPPALPSITPEPIDIVSETQYEGSFVLMWGLMIIGALLLINEYFVQGFGAVIVAMLGFVLRRIRIEGDKTRQVFKQLLAANGRKENPTRS